MIKFPTIEQLLSDEYCGPVAWLLEVDRDYLFKTVIDLILEDPEEAFCAECWEGEDMTDDMKLADWEHGASEERKAKLIKRFNERYPEGLRSQMTQRQR